MPRALSLIVQDYTGTSDNGHGEYPTPKVPILTEEPLDTDFRRKYPPDPLGYEVHDAARVWRVYRDEAKAHDDAMLDGWNKTLDVLLIFAGLFSAVATAFLIDSYKLLQPDNSAAYMSTALYLLVTRDNATLFDMLPPPPRLATSTSTIARAVNWLWFTSLLLSLAVALLGILIKQWIVEYSSRNTSSAGSPRHWAVRHQLYFQAMTRWPVADLVSILPVMLHTSLFLFFGGVALFVWDLDLALGIWITALGLLLGGFYIGCSVIPLWVPECPTSTPMVHLIRKTLVDLRIATLQIRIILYHRVRRLCALLSRASLGLRSARAPDAEAHEIQLAGGRSHEDQTPRSQSESHMDLDSRWSAAISQLREGRNRRVVTGSPHALKLRYRDDTLKADALLWLIFCVPDSDSIAVGLQALGAVELDSTLAKRLRRDGRLSLVNDSQAYVHTAGLVSPFERTRVARSVLWLETEHPARLPLFSPFAARSPTWDGLWDAEYPDAQFLYVASRPSKHAFNVMDFERPDPAPSRGLKSPSMLSTFRLFLRARRLTFYELLRALLLCDLDWLPDEDWKFVLEQVVAGASEWYRTPLLILPSTSHYFVVLDILAQCLTGTCKPRSRTEPDITIMIHSLIASILRWSALASVTSCNHSFLFPYLASEGFEAQELDAGTLGSIPYLLSETSKRVFDHQPSILVRFRALSALLRMHIRARLSFDSFWSTSQCEDAMGGCTTHDGTMDTRALSTTLRYILNPLEEGGDSIWDLLAKLESDGRTSLAHHILRALCIVNRGGGEDVSSMIDAFLPSVSLRNFLEMFTLQISRRETVPGEIVTGSTMENFGSAMEHVVRHCVELRPSWWLDQMRIVMDGESSDQRLREHAQEIDAQISAAVSSTADRSVYLGRAEPDGYISYYCANHCSWRSPRSSSPVF